MADFDTKRFAEELGRAQFKAMSDWDWEKRKRDSFQNDPNATKNLFKLIFFFWFIYMVYWVFDGICNWFGI